MYFFLQNLLGVKTPEKLLAKLKRAIKREEKSVLEHIINECVASGFPELNSEIEKAREILKEMEDNPEGLLMPNSFYIDTF